MVLLPGRGQIDSSSQLSAALTAGINRAFVPEAPSECVSVQGDLPAIDLLRIDVSSARLVDGNNSLPVPGMETAERQPLGLARRMELVGEPVRVTDHACLNFQLCASDVRLETRTDENNTRWLAIADAEEGSAHVDVDRRAIEGLFLRGAQIAAQGYGLEVERAGLTLSPHQGQSVTFDAEVTVRRRRLSATLSVGGRLLFDQELNAGFSELSCSGKGAVGTLACAIIKRHLSKLENKRFPLLGFNLGGLRLREMNVEVGAEGSLHAKAVFGSHATPQQTSLRHGNSWTL
jgi:hypothetical protein